MFCGRIRASRRVFKRSRGVASRRGRQNVFGEQNLRADYTLLCALFYVQQRSAKLHPQRRRAQTCDDRVASRQPFQHRFRLRFYFPMQTRHARRRPCDRHFARNQHAYSDDFLFPKENTFRLEKTKLSLRVFGEIISLGLASFIAEFGFGLVMMLINKLFKSLGGDTAVAAFAIVVNVFYVINAIFNGISAGTQPIISFSYGQHDFTRIRQVLKYALITIGATAAVLYVALFFSADGIAAIFNTEKAEDLQKIATTGIKLYFISSLFSGFNLLFSSYFSASDKGVCSQIITLLRGVVLIIPLAYLFAHLWKITGLWLATPAAEMLTLVAAIIIFFISRKKRADTEIPAPVSEQE